MTETLIKVGAPLPRASFFVLRGGKTERVSSSRLFSEGRSVLVGMPGAFTPTCSRDHLPSLLRAREQFQGLGVVRLACLTTQDPFVMQAWRESYGESSEDRPDLPPLLMLSDAAQEATRTFGMIADMSAFGLGLRSRRFAVVLEGLSVRWLSSEEERGACRLSAAASILEALRELA